MAQPLQFFRRSCEVIFHRCAAVYSFLDSKMITSQENTSLSSLMVLVLSIYVVIQYFFWLYCIDAFLPLMVRSRLP